MKTLITFGLINEPRLRLCFQPSGFMTRLPTGTMFIIISKLIQNRNDLNFNPVVERSTHLAIPHATRTSPIKYLIQKGTLTYPTTARLVSPDT
jgi:hypothetical protein